MTGPELSTALQTLGLDTQAAAKWLGVSVRAVQRYRVSGVKGPVAGMVRIATDILKLDRHEPDSDGYGWFGMSQEPYGDYVERRDVVNALALDWRE